MNDTTQAQKTLVVVHPHFMYPGGASRAILETMRHLVSFGYTIHLVSLRHPSELSTQYPMLHFHALGGPLSGELRHWLTLPRHYYRLERLIGSLRPTILIASVFPANYWAFFYRLRHPRIPCCWYCQEPSAFVHDHQVIAGIPWPMRAVVYLANPALQLLDRALVRAADAILVNSRYSAGRVRKVYRRSSTVLRLGVETGQFAPTTPKSRAILTVGRLTHFKRLDIFLRAAAILQGRGYTDLRWQIIGDGEAATILRDEAKVLGVEQIVEFAGRLPARELAARYDRAAIVTITAIGEPFGLVALEGLAAGAAIVCSDSGGPAETIRNGETGVHFRSGNANDCADQIERLLNDRALATALAKRGRAMVEQFYSWENTAYEVHAALRRMTML